MVMKVMIMLTKMFNVTTMKTIDDVINRSQ